MATPLTRRASKMIQARSTSRTARPGASCNMLSLACAKQWNEVVSGRAYWLAGVHESKLPQLLGDRSAIVCGRRACTVIQTVIPSTGIRLNDQQRHLLHAALVHG